MKTIFFLLSMTAIIRSVFSQDITGTWRVALQVQGISLPLVFHIKKGDTAYSATMDSPAQGVKGIPVSTTSFADSILTLAITNAGIAFTGRWQGDSITGNFKRSGQVFLLQLVKEEDSTSGTTRKLQEPQPPYPYLSAAISFENKKWGITLAGTLTLPEKEGHFPAVILITGSGPQDRDEEVLGHKPFLVLADYLTRNGIAVLRYDDRGVGLSKGNF